MPTIKLDIEVDASKGTATLKQFSGDAEAATKKVGDAAKEGSKGFGQFASSLDETVGKLTELLTPANLLGSVIGVTIVESLRRAINATVEYAHEMQRLSLVTGASIGDIAELADAAEKLGIGSNRLNRAFFLLSSEIESGGRNLAKLGIATRDASGAQLESIDILRLMSEKFQTMNSASERAVAARKAFGRQAVDLLPLFELERKQIEELGASGREFSEVFGKETVKSTILFGGALAEVGQSMTRVQATLVMDLMPSIKALADTLALLIDILWKIPAPIRIIGETLAAMAAAAIGAALVVKGLVVALGVAGWGAAGAALSAWLGPIALVAAGLAALIILGPQFIAWITSLIPQAVVDKWHTFTAAISSAYAGLKALLGLQSEVKPMEAKEAGKTEKTAQELATELSFDKRIIEAQLALFKAKHDTFEFEVESSRVRQQLALRDLDIEKAKTTIPAEVAKLEAAKSALLAAGSAERFRIEQRHALELTTLGEQATEQYIAEQAKRRDAALAARSDEVAQAKILVKAEFDAFGISQQQYADETIRLNGLELAAKQKALQQELRDVKQIEAQKELLLRAKIGTGTPASTVDAEIVKLHAETQVKIAELDAKGAAAERDIANQNSALKREIDKAYYDFAAQAENADLARKVTNLEQWKADHGDKVKLVMAADAGLFQAREEGYTRDVQAAINARLKITAGYLTEAQKQDDILTGYHDKEIARRQTDIDNFTKGEVWKTGLLEDETLKRIAGEAKGFTDAQALRQQSIDAIATLLQNNGGVEDAAIKALIAKLQALAGATVDVEAAVQAKKTQDLQALQQTEINNYATNELAKTGILQDALNQRLEKEAKAITDVRAAYQKGIDDIALLLDQNGGRQDAALTALMAKLQKVAGDTVNVTAAVYAKQFSDWQSRQQTEVNNYAAVELAKTGILQDALNQRLAAEAKAITDIQAARQKVIADMAIVLEQQARQAGDLGAAFQVGFAQAASSASDAFQAMAAAGTQTYGELKTGLSDFLYEILSTSGKIGDVMVSLGKRILKTMTDTFAEILVRWAATAAGFSLPTILGTGTAIAGAAIGFEGAPNASATAVTQLATSAQTATGALGGMAQTTGVVAGVFGSLGSLLLSFGTVVLGVVKLLASIMTAGGLGGGVGAAGSGLLSNLGSLGSAFSTFSNLIMGKLADTIQSVFNAFGGSGVFGGALGPAGGAGVAANLLGQAIPIAGGLIQMALAGINGDIGGLVGGGIGGAIGAFFGGPVGFAIGEMIGNFIGSLIGGFFKGPTPEISGMVRLNPTTLDELRNAQNQGVFSTPGKSNFSWSTSGPLYEEMYKHRTEGNLNREDTQLFIMKVILTTLQEAFAGLDRLSVSLPTDLKTKLSDRITAVLAEGFQITDFKFKDSDVGDMLNSFKAWLTGLSGNVLQTVVTKVFGNIDLAALGAGDAAKGFDTLMQAMSAMGAVFKALDGAVNTSTITLEQFASGSVAFFQQFQKSGEAFADTITRVVTSLSGILQLRDTIGAQIAALSNDANAALAIVVAQTKRAEDQVVALADAFMIAAHSMAPPDEVLAKAQAVQQAITSTLQAEIDLVTKLHDEVVRLQTAITTAITDLGNLTASINALSGQAVNFDAFMQQATQAWNAAADNVTARISIFSSAIALFVASLQQAVSAGASLTALQTLFTQGVQALGYGFQVILQQIAALKDPQQAVTALQGLAQAIQQGLAGAIAATQTYYARLRQQAQDAATAQIDALNKQKTAIQDAFTLRIDALNAEKTRLQDLFTAQIDALNAQKTAIQEAVTARIDALNAEKTAIQDAFTARMDALNQEKTDIQDTFTARIETLNNEKTALQDAYTSRIDALNTEKTAIQDAFTARLSALNAELAIAQKWATVLGGVKATQDNILKMLAPTHPQTSLNDMLAQFRAAFTQFQTGPTPDLGTLVDTLAQQVIALAQQTPGYELPSQKFQDLIGEIQRVLASVAGTASSSSRTPEAIQADILSVQQDQTVRLKAIDYTLKQLQQEETTRLKAIDNTIKWLQAEEKQQLADIDATIKQLTNENKDQLKSIDDQIKLLQQQEKDQLKSIDDQIKLLQQQEKDQLKSIDDQIKALQADETAQLKAIDDQIATVNAALQATLTALSQQEQAAIAYLQQQAAAALERIRVQLVVEITALQAQEAASAARLQAILGDKSFEQFIAEKQAEAARALWVVNATLKWYLGELINRAFPGAGMPEAATGMDYVPQDGPVFLHRGERVLTAADNQTYSRGSDGGSRGDTNVNLTISVTASGEINAKRLADQLEGEFVRKIRTGRIRSAIQEIKR